MRLKYCLKEIGQDNSSINVILPFSTEPLDNTEEISFTRKEIFIFVKSELNGKINVVTDIVEMEVSKKLKHPYILPKSLKDAVSKLISEFRKRWQQVSRNEMKFFQKFDEWLNVPVSFTIENEGSKTSAEDTMGHPCTENTMGRPSTTEDTVGRPSTSWGDLSDRSKRRRTEKVRKEHTVHELAYATQMGLRASGNLNASNVIRDITQGSPSRASQYRKSMKRVSENVLSGDEALSLIVEGKMTKGQYQLIRSVSVNKNCKLYPPYGFVLDSKKKCYPAKSEISVTESGATVGLQALLNHTAERILMVQSDVIRSLPENKVGNLELICKWGCDGTSGQSTYKQKFSDGNKSDANIFFISLVPLQIFDRVNPHVIIWKNPRPSSPRFCRPIKIEFLHETAEATRAEVDCIEAQKRNLVPFETVMSGKQININFKLVLTMIDGKVCNSITNTSSSMRCYLCGATSKEFNDIDKMLQRPIIEDRSEFGISSLHAWIRLFECCLHVAYKFEIKKWQGREEDKEDVARRKKNIQQGFRDRLGLIVDQPKPGYGSSNDGNTARSFFENSEISASITGIDEELIKRFHVVLQVISCGFGINIPKFRKYGEDTARKFVELYSWYFMPTTVHKILIHGHQIAESSLLPIGQMSEEAKESCNKYIKRFREDFSRKCDRIKNMEDIFCRLLVTSDPIISSLRKLPPKKLRSLSPYAVELLISPSVTESRQISSNYTSDASDDDGESQDSD